MGNGLRQSNFDLYFSIFLIFLFLTMVNTYPLLTKMTTHQLGDGGDGPDFMWDLWSVKNSVMNFQNIYYTNYIFYPNGTNLYLEDLTPLNGVISIPLQYLFGENMILVYNVLVIINFVLAGLGMFMLAFYFTKNKFASFIAGYIFAFSPYMIGHALGHLSLTAMWPMPFFILCFLRFHKEKLIRNILLSSLFLALSTFASVYYGVFMVLLLFLFALFFIIKDWSKLDWKYYLGLTFIFIIYLFVVSPLVIGMVGARLSGNHAPNHNPDFWSPDVATFFVPGTLLKSKFLFDNNGWWNRVMAISHCWAENQNFLGYTILILSIFGVITALKNKDKNIHIKFWITLFILSFVFALGTKLKFFGVEYSLKLPHYYIYKIAPLVSVPGRFLVVVYISLAVLTAVGITNLSKKIKGKKKYLLYLVIFILIAGEFLAIPYKITSYDVPDFYYQLRSEQGEFVVHDLTSREPNIYHLPSGMHMYYQTIHHKKITGGRISRMNIPAMVYAINIGASDLVDLNVKYVICSKDSAVCSEFKDYPVVYRDESVYVHKIF